MANCLASESRVFEYQAFTAAQREFAEAVRASDLEGAQLAYDEIEGMWMNTAWPRLRSASAAFLDRHADYAAPSKFVVGSH